MNKAETTGAGPVGPGRGRRWQGGRSAGQPQCGCGGGRGRGRHTAGGKSFAEGQAAACCGETEEAGAKPVQAGKKIMKIGVTSQNFRTITAHGGKARRFIIFEVSPSGQISETERLDLPKEMSIHEHPCNAAHPIDGLDVLITGSCGDGFLRKLADRGIKVIVTQATDPAEAVAALVSGQTLQPALPESHDDGECGCEQDRQH